MRVIAWIMVVVAVVMVGLLGYTMYGMQLQVESVDVQALSALEVADQFIALRTGIDNDSLKGRIFNTSPLGNPEEYAFVTYTVRVSNVGLLPAEWIELVVSPDNSDVLQVDSGSAQALYALKKGDLKATVLVKLAEDGTVPTAGRSLAVSYFMFGRPYSVAVSL